MGLTKMARRRLMDLRQFCGALVLRHEYEPDVRPFTKQPQGPEPTSDGWLAYYEICIQYITSLHNQFVAILSIQGAVAIACFAGIETLTDQAATGVAARTGLAQILGVSAGAMEFVLTVVAVKLFRQHCVLCWMLARIEQEKLGLPPWASMKGLLGSAGNRLFTSPITLGFTAIYGLLLCIGLALSVIAVA